MQSEIDTFGGMLPVGKSLIVETLDEETPYLICTPTMIYPGDISGTRNVHLAMLGLLREVHQFNEINEGAIRSIAIPGLGTRGGANVSRSRSLANGGRSR